MIEIGLAEVIGDEFGAEMGASLGAKPLMLLAIDDVKCWLDRVVDMGMLVGVAGARNFPVEIRRIKDYVYLLCLFTF